MFLIQNQSIYTDAIVAAPPPYWLRDSNFTTMRLSLCLINTCPNFHNGKYKNQCREFKGVVRDLIKVQLGFAKVEVPFPHLIPERPECNRKIVTAFDSTPALYPPQVVPCGIHGRGDGLQRFQMDHMEWWMDSMEWGWIPYFWWMDSMECGWIPWFFYMDSILFPHGFHTFST